MDTRWLEDYLALIDFNGFCRAADKRAVSQPTFSRRIRSLEEWVGATLVDRSTHTMRLTPAGERFKMAAEATLRRLELGRDEAREIAKASSETLRFASTHVLSLTFFPTWLRRFESDEPSSLTVELTADHMIACEQLMIDGSAQFLLCHHHESASTRLDSDFRSIQLGEDILLPVMSPSLAKTSNLETGPLLAFTGESGMGRILAAARTAGGPAQSPQPIFASHVASVLTAMAKNGQGIAWTALSLVEDDIAAGRLVRAAGPEQDIPIEIRLWRQKARQAPAAEQFWNKIVKADLNNKDA
ncbi:MAG: LysR family transcriptional regulator [Emcibacter sp.]|nr:LysR family transcriptional regulator [Emcibacter sp.]